MTQLLRRATGYRTDQTGYNRPAVQGQPSDRPHVRPRCAIRAHCPAINGFQGPGSQARRNPATLPNPVRPPSDAHNIQKEPQHRLRERAMAARLSPQSTAGRASPHGSAPCPPCWADAHWWRRQYGHRHASAAMNQYALPLHIPPRATTVPAPPCSMCPARRGTACRRRLLQTAPRVHGWLR